MPLVTRLTLLGCSITAIPAVLKNNCQTYVSCTNREMYFSNAPVLHPPYSYQHIPCENEEVCWCDGPQQLCYFTVPMFWFFMEHHALNTSLKDRKYHVKESFSTCCWKQNNFSFHLYTPAVSGHTFITAVFFVPVFTLYCWVVAACPYAHSLHCSGVPRHTHLHLLKKKGINISRFYTSLGLPQLFFLHVTIC